MTRLYLIRHGETSLNRSGVFLGRTDCGLNDVGINQSKELANALESADIDIIVCSPLKRTYMTASFIAILKNLDIKIMEGLREMNFGTWEGMHYEEIAKIYPNEWKDWGENWLNSSPKDGENFQHFYSRISKTIDEILELYENKKVAIVTHDGVMKVAASILLKMGQEGFWNFHFEHGKYSVFDIQDRHCTIRKINV